MRSTRRCATGSPTSTTRSTSSAPSPGPHPYPHDGARLQRVIGREARAQMLEQYGRLPDVADRLRRRRLATRWACSTPFLNDARRAHRRRRSGGRGHRERASRRVARRRPPRRAARQPHLRAAGRRRPDHRDAFDLGRASTIPASAPSTRSSRTPAAREYVGVTDDEALAAFHQLAAPKASSPRSNRATRSRRR